MPKRIGFVIVSLALIHLTLSAQTTGYTDNFDGRLQVSGPPSFSFEQQDGLLKINIDKERKVWQGVYYEIGEAIDISAQPLLNLKMRSSAPFLLTAYIVDVNDKNMTQNIKIYATETDVNYCIDFEAFVSQGVDASQIKGLIFTPNGNTHDGLIADVYMDELKLGSHAARFASMGGVAGQTAFINSQNNEITIPDLKNAAAIDVQGGETLIDIVHISEIDQGRAAITCNTLSEATGTAILTVTALGADGYANNTLTFNLHVEDNAPPFMTPVPPQTVRVGQTASINLIGISDGNATVEQPLILTAVSSNQQALPDSSVSILYETGAAIGRLQFTVLEPAEDLQLALQINDQYAYNNITAYPINITALTAFNNPPTLDFVPNQFTYLSDGLQTISLSGISDGDANTQTLIWTVESSDETIVANADLEVSHDGGETAALSYTPQTAGTTTITLTAEDDGGNEDNNGNESISMEFEIEVGTLPLDGCTIPMADFVADTTDAEVGQWNVEGLGTAQIATLGTFHGKDNVIKIDIVEKGCWSGLWYRHPELNLTEHAYLSYDIYFEGGDFEGGSGQTHSYYWDADNARNTPRGHEQRKTVPAGQWQTVFMEYRGAGGMETNDGDPINSQRIQKILINYASGFGWPFPVNNGTVYIANIHLGSAVPAELVPAITPNCTIDPIADMTLFPDAATQTIQLSGISNGNDETDVNMTVKTNKLTLIPTPDVSAVDAEGNAALTFTPQSGTGSAVITITVSADGSNDRTRSFSVHVIDQSAGNASQIVLTRDSLYQTIHGFGTYSFTGRQAYMNAYTRDLGASAMRVGIIGNQLEPVNDNDDPNVLNRDALDYNAFDWDYYRQLKAKGVETFILTSWSPPAWMKRNLSESYAYAAAPNYDDTDNVLEPYYYEEFAETMVAAVRLFESEAGITLTAIGPQNEPAFCEPYPSAVLSPVEFAKVVAVVGERFEREGIQTKIYAPEQVFTQNHYSMKQYIQAIQANPVSDQYTDIIATHGYADDGIGEAQPDYNSWQTLWNLSQQSQFPKEFWMTETYPACSDWNSALSLAGAIHGALVYGHVGLWTLWDIEGTLMSRGAPTPGFYASKNFYKFIRPGARRIKAASPHQDVLVSAFIHDEDKTLTTVMINKNPDPVTITVSGDSVPAVMDMYVSAQHVHFEYQGEMNVDNPLALPGSSVITLTASQAGPFTDVADAVSLPKEYELYQNYPNPFNPVTTIQFKMPQPGKVTLTIFNILGEQVRTLSDHSYTAGTHHIVWDGFNNTGQAAASGIYIYQLKTDKFSSVKKCILMR